VRRLARILERAFALTGVMLVLYHLGFQVGRITSGSMQPTLRTGDLVLVEKVTRRIRRWDVLSFTTEDGIHVMKRVVGLPGESVSLAGSLRVDDVPLAPPPSVPKLTYYAYGNLAAGNHVAAGDGYYVLGDDSKDSQDSRFEGPVPRERTEGRAWLIVWPPAHAGRVR
jgi:signal peptidase I